MSEAIHLGRLQSAVDVGMLAGGVILVPAIMHLEENGISRDEQPALAGVPVEVDC